ncbi:hypothetical protein NQ176_g67 [Zarea fungicola]|uniref:Uncharacterized protein n=1 Tax=Zarea fungicola TaxID=93591 RepID=A0ACC1NZR0_9HYPO|nr:hypothetical protein NQ176_g67 [Lecanicillium fungicola]
MKVSAILAVAISGVAFAAPEVFAVDKSKPFKDLTNLKYNNELPLAKGAFPIERRNAAAPIKDNRKLHYNIKNKLPIAVASSKRRDASQPQKDNRNLHYNVKNKLPIAFTD